MELISTIDGNKVELVVIGKLDSTTAPEFDSTVASIIEGGARQLRVDLAGLDYIGSAGLRSLLTATKQMQQRNGEIGFSGVHGNVEEVLRISGFLAVIPMVSPRKGQGGARGLSDREYAECFNAFKQISSEWGALVDWFRASFLPTLPKHASLNVLSIGSGTGDFDMMLMRLLLDHGAELSYTAMDPNEEHNSIFRERLLRSDLQPSSFRIIPSPFTATEAEGSYDIIHLTHCLYYIDDRSQAIRRSYELLNPGGALLIFHQTPVGINELQRSFMREVKGNEREMFSSKDIMIVFEQLGIPCHFEVVVSDLDVTDCITGTDRGRLLLNFLLESDTACIDELLRRRIVATIKEISRRVGDRYLLFHPGGIFLARKPA